MASLDDDEVDVTVPFEKENLENEGKKRENEPMRDSRINPRPEWRLIDY